MKSGQTLQELAAELQRQQQSKRDFIVNTPALEMAQGKELTLRSDAGLLGEAFPLTNHTHRQIGTHLNIPAKYYDFLQASHPDLLDANVNALLERKPARRMLRTLDGKARAFLSDSYRCLDNYDLAETVLPILMEQQGVRIESCQVTERRMYIKAIFPQLSRPDPGARRQGMIVNAGVTISNSEIGQGSLRIEPLLYFLACLNGMIGTTALRKNHVGKRSEDEGEIYSTETKIADDKVFHLKVRDTVMASCDEAAFNVQVDRVQAATENRIEAPADKFVEELQKTFLLTDGERGSILNQLIQGGDLSQYGALQAVTAASQTIDDYDRATELERMGGQIIELPRSDWQRLAA